MQMLGTVTRIDNNALQQNDLPTGMNEDSTVDTYLKTKDFVKQENS
jgi:hypothetical protein